MTREGVDRQAEPVLKLNPYEEKSGSDEIKGKSNRSVKSPYGNMPGRFEAHSFFF